MASGYREDFGEMKNAIFVTSKPLLCHPNVETVRLQLAPLVSSAILSTAGCLGLVL